MVRKLSDAVSNSTGYSQAGVAAARERWKTQGCICHPLPLALASGGVIVPVHSGVCARQLKTCREAD